MALERAGKSRTDNIEHSGGPDSMTQQLRFEISSGRAAADVPIVIRLAGAKPMEPVTIHADLEDYFGVPWVSHATFTADESGRVDLEQDAPLTGSYPGVDSMGLFWSMTARDPTPVVTRSRDSLHVKLTAETNDTIPASATVQRLVVPDGVTVRDVRQQGLVGTFFQPLGPGPHPAVITLSGSSGGLYEPPAALLAGHGLARLALAYFGFEDLPGELVSIPLEYFETALGWLQCQASVSRDAIAVVGSSRGGELALLLGATFPPDSRAGRRCTESRVACRDRNRIGGISACVELQRRCTAIRARPTAARVD